MIPQFPEFKKIELSDREEVEKITSQFPPYSDFNFTSMWCWNTDQQTKISILEGNLVACFTDYLNGKKIFSFIGLNNVAVALKRFFEFLNQKHLNNELCLIGSEIALKIPDSDFAKTEDRNNFDYVYSIKDLCELKGRKFETKRNLINRFLKKNLDHSIKKIDLANDFEVQALNFFIKNWDSNKKSSNKSVFILNEVEAFKRFFKISLNEQFLCYGVYVGYNLSGFSIVEVLKNEWSICHFSKTDIRYAGANDYLLWEISKILDKMNISAMNYEQDLGIPSLRHSKLSFRPNNFLKKYSVKKII